MKINLNARQLMLDSLPENGVGAELGVFKGDFSAQLLARTKPKRLHLIDPWQSNDAETHQKAMYGSNNRSQQAMDAMYAAVQKRFQKQIEANTLVVDRAMSDVALSGFADGHFDWIYIDGDHTHQAVLADLRLSFAKVKRGGYIAGDDYVLGNWFRDGVVRALHDFLAETAGNALLSWLVDTQFLIRKL